MKKFLAFLLVLIFLVVAAIFLAWTYKTSLAARYMSRELNDVPVELSALELSKNNAQLLDLHIGTLPNSKTETSLDTRLIDIDATWKGLRGDPLTVEAITVNDILLAVEYYNESGTENNWTVILSDDDDKDKKPSNRKYLIKKLSLNRLTVQVTDFQGNVTRYPTLDKLEFYNISDETGFPIDEIEKAILNTVLRSVFRRLGLDALMQSINPSEWAPKVLPFFGMKEKDI